MSSKKQLNEGVQNNQTKTSPPSPPKAMPVSKNSNGRKK